MPTRACIFASEDGKIKISPLYQGKQLHCGSSGVWGYWFYYQGMFKIAQLLGLYGWGGTLRHGPRRRRILVADWPIILETKKYYYYH